MTWLFVGHAGLLVLIYIITSTPLIPPPDQGNIADTRRFASELVALNTTIGAVLAVAGIIIFISIGRRIVRRQEATPKLLMGHTLLLLIITTVLSGKYI